MTFEKFRRAVEERELLAPADQVLCAVSGGGDSVALLRLLLEYSQRTPVSIVVAHVNHRLRGEAADEDQRFVERLSVRLGLECVVLAPRHDQERLEIRRGEEGARRVRHDLLRGAARAIGCPRIALGHTMDDQAETVLMRLLRGAGRRGLSGMAHAGAGRLIRPMLDIRRDEVRAYLREIGQDFREDETNAEPRFLRNKVRARLIPLLAELNPSIVRTLARNAGVMAEEDAYLDMLAAEWVTAMATSDASDAHAFKVPAGALASLPAVLARRAARLLLKRAGADPRGASLRVIGQLLDMVASDPKGAELLLPPGVLAVREGSDLVIRGGDASPVAVVPPAPFSAPLEIPGGVSLPGDKGSLRAIVVLRTELGEIPNGPIRVALDADRLGPAVKVRTRQAGDTFHPLGAAGHRKLKEFLIDCKVPRTIRDRIPLVVGPSGIAWVVGYRIGHEYRLTDTTRNVAVLEYTEQVDLTPLPHYYKAASRRSGKRESG